MLINSICDLGLSHKRSRLLFRVSCIKKQAEVLPHQTFLLVICLVTMVPF